MAEYEDLPVQDNDESERPTTDFSNGAANMDSEKLPCKTDNYETYDYEFRDSRSRCQGKQKGSKPNCRIGHDLNSPAAEDETLPAIQIYKTFSLANFNSSSPVEDRTSASMVDGESCHQESYMLTDLDYDVVKETEYSSLDDPNGPCPPDVHKMKEENSCCEYFEGMPMKPENKEDTVSATPSSKCGSGRIHVINLESIKNCEPIYTQGAIQYQELAPETTIKSISFSDAVDHSPESGEFLLSTKIRPNTGLYDLEPKQFKQVKVDKELLFDNNINGDRPEHHTQSLDFSDGHLNSMFASTERDLSIQQNSHIELQTLGVDGSETSDMVVDLDESLAIDSGVFDLSLTTKQHIFGDHPQKYATVPFSTATNKHLTMPTNPEKNIRTTESILDITGGENMFLLPDGRDPAAMQCFTESNIVRSTLSGRRNEDHLMKPHNDPYITDRYGFYPYQPYPYPPFTEAAATNTQYSSPGCSSTWDRWSSLTNSGMCSSMQANFPSESSSGGVWYSDHAHNFFEGYDPPNFMPYSQPIDVEDEEETDDAEETVAMAGMTGIPYLESTPGYISCSSNSSHRIDDSPALSCSTNAAISPPPSASSTPISQHNYCDNYGQSMEDPHFFNAWLSLPQCSTPVSTPLETCSTSFPFHKSFQSHNVPSKDKPFDPAILSCGLQRGMKRPYATMADGSHLDRSYCPPLTRRQGHCQGYRENDDGYDRNRQTHRRRGGKLHKNQIQSDAISTSSTTVNSKGGRAKGQRHQQATHPPGHALHDARGLGELMVGTSAAGGTSSHSDSVARLPRHNEPLNQRAVDVMTRWYNTNIDNPYPTKAQKVAMAREGHITENQVKSWFANKRNRTHNTKPKVQKRAMEEKLKELFRNLKHNNPIPGNDNNQLIQQLSGIIQHCHMNLE